MRHEEEDKNDGEEKKPEEGEESAPEEKKGKVFGDPIVETDD